MTNKFGKLGKILLLSTAMAAAPICANAQESIGRHDNAVPLEQFETIQNGERIQYMRLESPAEIGSKTMTMIVVADANGKVTSYIDMYGDDMQIDRMQIIIDGKETEYNKYKNPQVFVEGQKRFNHYLKFFQKGKGSLLD
jgi:hypothetical protein